MFLRKGFPHSNFILFAGLTPINRNQEGFACPICLTIVKTTRSCITHIKRHGINVSLAKKRKLEKLNNVDEHYVGEEEADEETDQYSASEEEAAENTGQHPDSEEDADEEEADQYAASKEAAQLPSSPTTKLSRLTHRDVILSTTDSLAADEATQEDKMMLAKLGRWVPVVYKDDDMEYRVLTSSSIASILLSKNQTTGTWCSPISDNNHSPKEVMKIDASHFIRHLKITR